MSPSLHARIDGEREAKQLLPPLSLLVVCLKKSRMCQNKYTVFVKVSCCVLHLACGHLVFLL